MTANTDPIFAKVPRIGVALLADANPGRDGTGFIENVLTAGENGARIDKLSAKATASTTPGMIRLFIHDGQDAHLLDEIEVGQVNAAASVATWGSIMEFLGGLVLPPGYSLQASTEQAEGFVVMAHAGDF